MGWLGQQFARVLGLLGEIRADVFEVLFTELDLCGANAIQNALSPGGPRNWRELLGH